MGETMLRPNERPDSDFQYRIVSGYDGHRLTWHSMECTVGKNAKRARRTVYTPETRQEFVKARQIEKFGNALGINYHDYMAKCCTGKEDTSSLSFTRRDAKVLFDKAYNAGVVAGNGAKPTPMVVGQAKSFFSNEIDYSRPTHYVADGACGYAWVTIRPGGSSIARHAVRLGIGRRAYGGGVSIYVWDHGQSLERKSAHAYAYSNVLREHGINAHSESRID